MITCKGAIPKSIALFFFWKHVITSLSALCAAKPANLLLVINWKPVSNYLFIHLSYVNALNKICLFSSFVAALKWTWLVQVYYIRNNHEENKMNQLKFR